MARSGDNRWNKEGDCLESKRDYRHSRGSSELSRLAQLRDSWGKLGRPLFSRGLLIDVDGDDNDDDDDDAMQFPCSCQNYHLFKLLTFQIHDHRSSERAMSIILITIILQGGHEFAVVQGCGVLVLGLRVTRFISLYGLLPS